MRLCQACRRGLTDDLARLAILYHTCGYLLESSPPRLVRDKISGGPARGASFNMAAAEVRAAILGVLASWSGMVADGRGVSAPERTVGALAGFLVRHAGWLSAREAAPEATRELGALVRRARAVSDPRRKRRIVVATCVEPGCPGHLIAVVRPQDAALPSEIICDRDPAHCWPAGDWVRLSNQIGHPVRTASAWLTAADISCIWRTPVGSVYRLACEGKWQRRRQAGRTYYHEADVEQTFRHRRR